jgi:hypothetical protein
VGLKRLEPTIGEARNMADIMKMCVLGPLDGAQSIELIGEIMADDGPMRDLAVHLLRTLVYAAEETYGFAHEGVPPLLFNQRRDTTIDPLDIPGIIPSVIRDARRSRFEAVEKEKE